MKSLHKENDFNEMKIRIARLSEDSKRKWGRMNTAQMLCHCNLILQIPLKKIELPEINILFRTIGICTKKEMQIFNNGIPHNMPCFRKVIVNFECDFEQEKTKLLKTLDEYQEAFRRNQLPGRHVLFGKMTEKDWGFLEYKHLDHHLKQFSI
ncbi:DUF1569 domain-containing protein [Chryseobacterium zhengzhouense]|uniref:DUF1569 domain-containing protein n=1 Tax=Chryseobacterium zhengzhouense TaxID=1636086 RepID=A0ABW2LU30_9FLAO